MASGYTAGLRGGTLKCLRFRHICRQDVGVGDGGRKRFRGAGGGESLLVLLMSCDNEQHPLTPSQHCWWTGAAHGGAATIKFSFLREMCEVACFL